jgi:proteic killer suppression protein
LIKSFENKITRQIWERERVRGLDVKIQQAAQKRLNWIDAAIDVQSLRFPPSNHLKKLSGIRKNQWSTRVNNQYRICFEWHGAHAENVEFCDYH